MGSGSAKGLMLAVSVLFRKGKGKGKGLAWCCSENTAWCGGFFLIWWFFREGEGKTIRVGRERGFGDGKLALYEYGR